MNKYLRDPVAMAISMYHLFAEIVVLVGKFDDQNKAEFGNEQ